MIAVLADDLTGAAELGGIGLHYNLKVEISSLVNPDTKADLLIIYTNSRSMTEKEAVKLVGEKLQQLSVLNPGFIYKKVDSVLRGHIVSELAVQMNQFKKNKALLLPANPHLGRTIFNGIYFVEGVPILQTSFAKDPEFPITTSGVSQILSRPGLPVQVLTRFEHLPGQGIFVGEVEVVNDFSAWLTKADEDTVLAGGSGFFTAILDSLFERKKENEFASGFQPGTPALVVSGTSFEESLAFISKLKMKGIPVSYMPGSLMDQSGDREEIAAWGKSISAMFNGHDIVIMAMNDPLARNVSADPVSLTKKMAMAVQEVLQLSAIRELFIEGGSTAFAIIRQLEFTRFYPTEELSHGVIRMSVEGRPDLHLTIKPGSYHWPQLTNFNMLNRSAI